MQVGNCEELPGGLGKERYAYVEIRNYARIEIGLIEKRVRKAHICYQNYHY
jgi:hypothetical protein